MSCNYTFDSTHFLKFAKELKEKENLLLEDCDCNVKQCIYRTIISRAYYSAFLSAQEKINKTKYKKSLQKGIRNVGSHNAVIDILLEINFQASNYLSILKKLRVDADYNLDALIDNDIVLRSIQLSENTIKLLKK